MVVMAIGARHWFCTWLGCVQEQTLREIGDAVDGMDCKNVSTCVPRFERKLTSDPSLKAIAGKCLKRLTIDET